MEKKQIIKYTIIGILLVASIHGIYELYEDKEDYKKQSILNSNEVYKDSILSNQVNGEITEESIKEIALNHAGVTSDEVLYIKTQLDSDDGIIYYEIDFVTETKEYEYEIESSTGSILEYNIKTIKVDSNLSDNTNTTYIGETKAKAIAVEHAGVSSSSVRYTKCELDYDNGIVEYEVEFLVGNTEYEYTINAITGDILEFDIDYNN
ncbi:MAG: PepSY domain-containing protein [bacterium]